MVFVVASSIINIFHDDFHVLSNSSAKPARVVRHAVPLLHLGLHQRGLEVEGLRKVEGYDGGPFQYFILFA